MFHFCGAGFQRAPEFGFCRLEARTIRAIQAHSTVGVTCPDNQKYCPWHDKEITHFRSHVNITSDTGKSLYPSPRTSPGRSDAFSIIKMQYLSQKETHEIRLYQRIFRFIINNLKQRHSGFFAVFGQHRRTALDNAKKTGIQIRPAAMNAHFPSQKYSQRRLSLPHGIRR